MMVFEDYMENYERYLRALAKSQGWDKSARAKNQNWDQDDTQDDAQEDGDDDN